jgi:predicted ATPase
MLQRSAYVGLQELSMPSLSGVVADFVSEILVNSPSRRTTFHRVAQQIEESVLRGTVQQVVKESGYPEIEYTDEYGSHPVHRTSSMVSELAPVVLLLRSSIRVGDLLIIEEPESHLHPEAQVEFAAALYDLAQRGVRVFATTHSDYFLSALSNRSREDAVRRRKKRINTRAFWMSRTPVGSYLERLPSDDYDGISDESFVAVAERLYDQRVEQQMALATVGNSVPDDDSEPVSDADA